MIYPQVIYHLIMDDISSKVLYAGMADRVGSGFAHGANTGSYTNRRTTAGADLLGQSPASRFESVSDLMKDYG